MAGFSGSSSPGGRKGYGVFIACAVTVILIAALWLVSFYSMFVAGVHDDAVTEQTAPVQTMSVDEAASDTAEPVTQPPETEPETVAETSEAAETTEYQPSADDGEVPFDTSEAVPETSAETEAETAQHISADYDFGSPVPECDPVDDSYFADAVFIGDSRTVGFSMHSGIKSECFYAAVGLHIGNLFTEKFLTSKDQNGDTINLTVMEALEYYSKYTKVYICFGLNEMGWYGSSFIRIYTDVIDHIKEIRPDVTIYIENIIPITAYASVNHYPASGNPRIWEYNEQLAQLAKDEDVCYLDLFSAFADDTGALPDDGNGDGVHFSRSYYQRWGEYLRTHVAQ